MPQDTVSSSLGALIESAELASALANQLIYKVAEGTTSAEATDVTITGLDGNTEDTYLLITEGLSQNTSEINIRWNTSNEFGTTSAFLAHDMQQAGMSNYTGGVGATRVAGDATSAAVYSMGFCWIRATTAKKIAYSQFWSNRPFFTWSAAVSADTTTNITDLTFHAAVANGIAAGFKYTLYKFKTGAIV